MGFQNLVVCADQQVLCGPFVLVDQATKNRSMLDPLIAELGHGVGWSWRAKCAGAVRASTVGVPDVLREHHTQGSCCVDGKWARRPMRGLKWLRSARVICAGHAFVQNVRRGHYGLGSDADPKHRLTTAFTELALAI